MNRQSINTSMPDRKPVIHIIDDDPSALRGLRRLMNAYGYDTCVFSSAREFLAAGLPGADSCIIIDVLMPDMNGLELREELTRLGCLAPVIFITAQDDRNIEEKAKRAGYVAFLQKPVDGDVLLNTIQRALAQDDRGTRTLTKLAKSSGNEQELIL